MSGAPETVTIVGVSAPKGKWVEILLDDDRECITDISKWAGHVPAEGQHKGWVNPSKFEGRLPIFNPAKEEVSSSTPFPKTSYQPAPKESAHDIERSVQNGYSKDLTRSWIEYCASRSESLSLNDVEAIYVRCKEIVKDNW